MSAPRRSLRIQLWSWNYEPEPTAMGPIATLWAREMAAKGHDVQVFAAHPHYPPDAWPQRLRAYREMLDGIPVIRLPLWIGHRTGLQRVREEVTYGVSAAVAAALARPVDVAVVVSPAFLALAPVMFAARVRRHPWVLWLQDILPDAAATTGLLRSGAALAAARSLERAAYRSAARIVTISDTFTANLRTKGVPADRTRRIYNPATVRFAEGPRTHEPPYRLLYTGNIGYSQGLGDFVRLFESSESGGRVKLVIVGYGELSDAVRRSITTDKVEMIGYVSPERLERELQSASLGLVCQRADIAEFNVPSKLMNLMARGLPVLAHVPPCSETARIVSGSRGGWVSSRTGTRGLGELLAAIVEGPEQLVERGALALDHAREHFDPSRFVESFERLLAEVAGRG